MKLRLRSGCFGRSPWRRRTEKYLERAKLYVGELEAVLGRQPTYHVQNFGCQMLTENRMQETA